MALFTLLAWAIRFCIAILLQLLFLFTSAFGPIINISFVHFIIQPIYFVIIRRFDINSLTVLFDTHV